MLNRYRFTFCIFLISLISISLKAQQPVISLPCGYEPTPYLGEELFYSTTGRDVTISDVKKLPFLKIAQNVPNFGVTDSVIWIKGFFESNEFCDNFLHIEYQALDSVQLYLYQDQDLVYTSTSGQSLLPGDWPIAGPNLSFPIPSDLSGNYTFYLKLSSKKQILAPIKFYSNESLSESLMQGHIKAGLYFGIIIVMILYNLFLFISVKDRNFFYYILYIASVGLSQGTSMGFTTIYLWPQSSWMVENSTYLFAVLSGLSTLLFLISFLKTKFYTPLIHKFFLWTAAAYGLILILVFFDLKILAYQLINLVAMTGSIVALITAVIITRKGYGPAKFFLFAYSFFLLSIIIFVLKDFGILPYSEFTNSAVIYGSSLEIVLLSLALANRINILREEKEISQAQALDASRENERIIREQNVLLEQKVNERTAELQEANEELTVTLSNLRDTQTQLVDAEKMASLGQLTAGIAHEINNPINFVTSNITPLKRDLDDVYELVDAYGKVTEEDITKLKEAHELKEEIDYDYLKEEIISLVDGISDGATRTSEIVRGLRTFSRLDEDVIKQADVHEGLASTLVLLRSKFNEGIKIVQEFDNELPQIECYPGKLNQVFMNILNNGIYAVNHKAYNEPESAQITIKTKKLENTVSIHLIDNGIGMDEETKKKMFDPFFTTKDVGEGTGLGMAIVYKIIQKHGGSLSVNSELGKGTEFIITLPLRQPNEFE